MHHGFFKENYFIEFSREGILFCQLHYSGNARFLKNIEYIHQLQNLLPTVRPKTHK